MYDDLRALAALDDEALLGAKHGVELRLDEAPWRNVS